MLVLRHLIVKEDNKVKELDIEVYTNDDIPEGQEIDFLTKDEIVDDLVNRVLSGEEKHDIKNQTAESLNRLATSLGSFIRNTYGLWLSPHPYTSPKNSSADNYPEKMTLEIIKNVKQRLET